MRVKSIRLLVAVCLTAATLVSGVVVDTAGASGNRTPTAQLLRGKRAPSFLRHARVGDINRLSAHQRVIVKRLVRNAAKRLRSNGAQAADSWFYLGPDVTTLDGFYMVDQWYYNATFNYYEGDFQTCDRFFCYYSHTYNIVYNGFVYGLYYY
jgi:hypothetical protein